ncbi:3-mercaptopyruvate sulfurtransferase-like isoform X2 [Dreissena polymorpha]|uniref:3-mercaptopyruvate sulfurtransferase-like isoform X2 n=1 Tax=Dreissena polymorpha TaxID=45954 RepID=UPI00226421A3|nr:3-mercaptopyruvate sulfurtransferase-like isoform X2 [Dreissena polymorpha]
MSCPLLVTCEWLQERLVKKDRPDVVVIDVSWSSTRDCQQDYLLQRIPSAQYVNVLDAKHSDVYPRAVPDAQVFAEHARRAGVNPSSHVVIYSNTEKAGYFLSGRGCWTFKYFGHDNVSILDGGLQRWLQLGYPTASGEEVTKPGSFKPVVNDQFRVPYESVRENQEKCSFQLVDTRPAKAFAESQIPGAVNLDMGNLIDEEKGIMKSPEEIRKWRLK